jgi:tRNA threonylcarbamoyladenosine modification (KEOPS) complex  Pcc1 subunit
MKSASFIFIFDSEEEARIIAESLSPEINNKIPKTNIKVALSKRTFTLNILANDISSLRAACNSYLRWINTALNVKKSV